MTPPLSASASASRRPLTWAVRGVLVLAWLLLSASASASELPPTTCTDAVCTIHRDRLATLLASHRAVPVLEAELTAAADAHDALAAELEQASEDHARDGTRILELETDLAATRALLQRARRQRNVAVAATGGALGVLIVVARAHVAARPPR